MAVIDHLDVATRRIYLANGVREFHPVDDIYKEIRTLRRLVEEYRGCDTPVVASGNVPKGGGKFTPRFAIFRDGWKIVPEDTSHVLYVSGEQITDTGEAGPACFDLTPLSPSSKVIIHYEPPSAEIIETGVSGLTEEESEKLMALPTEPELAAIHGSGSWEGATPAQLWTHSERKLTSREVDGEAISSEEQLEAALKELRDKLDEIKGKIAKARFSI